MKLILSLLIIVFSFETMASLCTDRLLIRKARVTNFINKIPLSFSKNKPLKWDQIFGFNDGFEFDFSALFDRDNGDRIAQQFLFIASKNPHHPLFIQTVTQLLNFRVFEANRESDVINSDRFNNYNLMYQNNISKFSNYSSEFLENLEYQLFNALNTYITDSKSIEPQSINVIQKLYSQTTPYTELNMNYKNLLETAQVKKKKKGLVHFTRAALEKYAVLMVKTNFFSYSSNSKVSHLKSMLFNYLLQVPNNLIPESQNYALFTSTDSKSFSLDLLRFAAEKYKTALLKNRYQYYANLYSEYLNLETIDLELEKDIAEGLVNSFIEAPKIDKLGHLIWVLATLKKVTKDQQPLDLSFVDIESLKLAVTLIEESYSAKEISNLFLRLEYLFAYKIETLAKPVKKEDLVFNLFEYSFLFGSTLSQKLESIAHNINDEYNEINSEFYNSAFCFDGESLRNSLPHQNHLGLLTKVFISHIDRITQQNPTKLSLSEIEDILLTLFYDDRFVVPKLKASLVSIKPKNGSHSGSIDDKYLRNKLITLATHGTSDINKNIVKNYIQYKIQKFLYSSESYFSKSDDLTSILKKSKSVVDGHHFTIAGNADMTQKIQIYKKLILFYESYFLDFNLGGINIEKAKLEIKKYQDNMRQFTQKK